MSDQTEQKKSRSKPVEPMQLAGDDTQALEIAQPGQGNLADTVRSRYRQLQLVCIFAAIVHAGTVLLGVFAVKEGNLYDLSVTRLLQFVPAFTSLWQLTCFAVAMSRISYLIMFVAFKHVVRVRQTMWLNIGTFLVIVAVSNDLQSLGNMMIYFSDVAHQFVHGTMPKSQLLIEGWHALSQSVTQTLLIANSLYATSGFVLAGAIISGFGLPKWLGWTAIPICLLGFCASVLVFYGDFWMAVVMLFATLIALILWSIAAAVAVDPFAHKHKPSQPTSLI